jgi:quercetin dioxygenase-like cupin family protein
MSQCVITAVTLGALFATTNLIAAESEAQTITIVDADKLEWKDYPGLPGVKFVVLAGNPSQPGLYVIRVKFAPHTMSRPHWHPETRYVVVLKGTWWAGEGDRLDPDSTTPLPTGAFAIHGPRQVHYDGAKDEEAIVQITGIGPSGTHVGGASKQ